MAEDFIESVTAITNRLRYLDTQRVVFGSSHHEYQFNRHVIPQKVEAFEASYEVSLPAPYRRFLTELGNGGAGPYYGVLPLEFELPELLQPFPFSQPNNDEQIGEGPIPGAVRIAEYGCGVDFILVVKGALAGQVWIDARYETGISPAMDDPDTPATFDSWWLTEMRNHLDRFEQILALMIAETDHEEIHRRLEPQVLQLKIDLTMLSIMNIDPTARPRVYVNKPWGQPCALVEDHYGAWLRNRRAGISDGHFWPQFD